MEITLEVDFAGKPIPRATKRLIFLPSFAPAAETCARTTVLVLAHVDIAAKSNEIPAAQALLAELGVASGAIVTLDALHCQKTF